jgi:hypothetical protein
VLQDEAGSEERLLPVEIDTDGAEISFVYFVDPHEGQTTSSVISFPLWKMS